MRTSTKLVLGASTLVGAFMYGWHQGGSVSPNGPAHPGNIGGELLPEEFGVTPLVGYRTWHVVNAGDGTGLALKSLHFGYLWKPETNSARCDSAGQLFFPVNTHKGDSPDIGCACGFYAQLPDQPVEEWEFMRLGRVSATGTINMWGRIIVCERGYKAQHVSIQDPVVLEVSCQKGCDNPVTRVELPYMRVSHYPAYCDEHRPGHSSPVVTVEAGIWLREACRELSDRYDIEFLTWSVP